MKIKRRFPNFFSGFEDDETEHFINNNEELLNIDWIKDYDNIKGHIGIFYSPENYEDSPDCLMALSKDENGKIIYFVVGYIYGDGKELGLENYTEYIKREEIKDVPIS